MFSGLCEIHVSVDPTQYLLLWEFCRQHPKCRMIHAVSQADQQLMISKWVDRKSLEELATKLKEIEDAMDTMGLRRVRSKMEMAMHGRGVPRTDAEYASVKEALVVLECGVPYAEFHVKVSSGQSLLQLTEDLKKLSVPDEVRTGMSVNICGMKKLPLLTIRVFSGVDSAVSVKDRIMDQMKSRHGWSFEDEIHYEFSVYDNNQNLDREFLSTR